MSYLSLSRLFWCCVLLVSAICCRVNAAEIASAPAVAVPAKLDIYLFIGQSNMAARAPVTTADDGKVERTFLFNKDGQWEAAAFAVLPGSKHVKPQGYNRYSTVEMPAKYNGFSSGYTFAQELTKQNPALQLGLVVNAIGGTSVQQWQKGNKSRFFDEAVRRTKAAMPQGTLRAILWHQGESNAADPAYLAQLAKMVADLRQELGVTAETVPFVAGELLPYPNFAAFNQRLHEIATVIPNSGFITSEGTGDIGDKLHFNAASQRLLGERYAKAVLALQAKQPAAPTSPVAK